MASKRGNSNTKPTDETLKHIFQNADKYLQGESFDFDLVTFVDKPNLKYEFPQKSKSSKEESTSQNGKYGDKRKS
ncbi:hypothetical protein PVAND_012585 [Polypedilum vanderplanki]|uniref:Uncharacterized protein n=1 Tax=Polypedilum vanderplanki TaxID=319348 RepID=A0A9J6CLY8_POLVA|nr:hypothetical protein PVAND_012585 [Polypedilum vanderplanki]